MSTSSTAALRRPLSNTATLHARWTPSCALQAQFPRPTVQVRKMDPLNPLSGNGRLHPPPSTMLRPPARYGPLGADYKVMALFSPADDLVILTIPV
ncbi:hypothetical protein RJ035_007450, partial [Blastomyces gilchristii]